MDDVWTVIDQLLDPAAQERAREELKPRTMLIGRIFTAYRDTDDRLAQQYVDDTYKIPLTFLAAAVVVLARTRVYPTLPTTGEIWTLARKVARMDREQYRAGHYLPPPRSWPPEGKRHAIAHGEFESLPMAVENLIPAGDLAALAQGRLTE